MVWKIKTFLFLPFLLLSLTACKGDSNVNNPETGNPPVEVVQEPKTPLDLQVKINGVTGGVAKLIGQIGTTNFLMDSTFVNADGSFAFQADTAIPSGLYFILTPDEKNYLQVLIDRDQKFEMTADYTNLLGSVQIKGSDENDLLYQNLRFEDAFQAKFKQINSELTALTEGTPEYSAKEKERDAHLQTRKDHLQNFKQNHPNSFFTKYKFAGQNPELRNPKLPDGTLDTALQVYYYRQDYWKDVDFGDIRLLRTPVIGNKLENYIAKFTPQNVDSVIKYADIVIKKAEANKEMFKFVVNALAIKYQKSTIMGGEEIFVHLVDNYFTDEKAFWSNPDELRDIRKQANEFRPSFIGNPAQDLRCKDVNGEYKTLHGMGAPVSILYMYSYDCDHCKEQTPEMLEVYNKWKGKGLRIFALCVEPDEAKWKQFIKNFHIGEWTNVHDPTYESRYYSKYHVDITPEIYVIDQEKKILAKDLHPDQLEPFLKEAFGEKK